MSSVTIEEFLTARLDEDEAAAKAATPGPWRYNQRKHTRLPGTAFFEEAVFAGPAGKDAVVVAATGETDDLQSMDDAIHIAANDPSRVLVDVLAKRQIFAECCISLENERPGYDGTQRFAWQILRLLASAYRDHPDWRDAWQ